jgi:hypothetical protein
VSLPTEWLAENTCDGWQVVRYFKQGVTTERRVAKADGKPLRFRSAPGARAVAATLNRQRSVYDHRAP